MEGLIRQLLTLPQLQELTAGMAGREIHSMVTGLSPVQRAAVAAAAAEQTGRPLLMLCADEQECARQTADLRALTGEEPVVLPAREWQLRPAAAYSRQWEYRRLWALYRLAQEKPRVIVATAAAMAQLCLPSAVLQKTAFTDGAAHGGGLRPRPAGRGRGAVRPPRRYSGYLLPRPGAPGALRVLRR